MTFLKRMEICGRLAILELFRLVFKPRRIFERIDKSEVKGKILFIRPDRLGDVIISTPIFRLMKKHFPNLQLVVLASKRNAHIVRRLPYIDRVVLYRKNPFLFLWSLFKVFTIRFDFACDLMDIPSVTSAVYLIFSRAKYRLGFSQKPSGYNVDFIYNVKVPRLVKEQSHIIERSTQVLRPFGIEFLKDELRPDFPLSKLEIEFGGEFVRKVREKYEKQRIIVGVNISAGKETRWWGEENYIALLNKLTASGFVVILMCEPKDEKKARNILSKINGAVELAPITRNFPLFASVLKYLDILITPDTSVVHIASAFGLPIVGLYPSDYQNLISWSPFFVPNRVIQSPVKDQLRYISVSDVFEAFVSLVKEIGEGKRKDEPGE